MNLRNYQSEDCQNIAELFIIPFILSTLLIIPKTSLMRELNATLIYWNGIIGY